MKKCLKVIPIKVVFISAILASGCTLRPSETNISPAASPLPQRAQILATTSPTSNQTVDLLKHDLDQADVLIAKKQYSAALNLLEQATQIPEFDARPFNAMGTIYLTQHRWKLAQARFQQVLHQEPENLIALTGLAEAYLQQGQAEQALRLWRQAIALDSRRASAWVGLGQTLMAQQQYQAAQQAFAQALNIVPQNQPHSEALWALGALTLPTDLARGRNLLAQMRPPTTQSAHLLATLNDYSADSSTAEIAKTTGIALMQVEAWALAHHAFKITVAANPEDAQGWLFLGHLQSLLGLPTEPAFETSAMLAPNSVLLHYFRGLHLRRQGHYQAALDHFLVALDLDPENLGVTLEAAQTFAEQGNYLSAELWYRALVEAEPESVAYRTLLAAFYIERGYQVAEVGVVEARHLVALAPEYARAHDLLGWALFQMGDFVNAEAALREAIRLDSTLIVAHYHLGRLLEVQQRMLEAAARFTTVINEDISGLYRQRLLGEN